MILKLAIAGALALAVSPSGLSPEEFGPVTVATHPYVRQVFCNEGRGTAFKISTGQWISVNHVSSIGGCHLDGRPIHVAYTDPRGDFSIIDIGDTSPGGIEVDCGGYREGQWYFGIGFGFNTLQSKAVRHESAPWLFEPFFNKLMANRFVPGMSGGPVLDTQGRVVGTVNAYGTTQRTSYSRALKDTIICEHSSVAQ